MGGRRRWWRRKDRPTPGAGDAKTGTGPAEERPKGSPTAELQASRESGWRRGVVVARWVVAAVVLTGGAFVVSGQDIPLVDGRLRVCREATSTEMTSPVPTATTITPTTITPTTAVEATPQVPPPTSTTAPAPVATNKRTAQASCRQPRLTDPTVVAIGLLALLLVLPGFSEVSISGILTLKAKVEEAAQRSADEAGRAMEGADRAVEAANRVDLRIAQAVQASAGAAARTESNVYFGAGAPDPRHRTIGDLPPAGRVLTAAGSSALGGVLLAARRRSGLERARIYPLVYRRAGDVLTPWNKDQPELDARDSVIGPSWVRGRPVTVQIESTMQGVPHDWSGWLFSVPIWSGPDRRQRFGVLVANLHEVETGPEEEPEKARMKIIRELEVVAEEVSVVMDRLLSVEGLEPSG